MEELSDFLAWSDLSTGCDIVEISCKTVDATHGGSLFIAFWLMRSLNQKFIFKYSFLLSWQIWLLSCWAWKLVSITEWSNLKDSCNFVSQNSDFFFSQLRLFFSEWCLYLQVWLYNSRLLVYISEFGLYNSHLLVYITQFNSDFFCLEHLTRMSLAHNVTVQVCIFITVVFPSCLWLTLSASKQLYQLMSRIYYSPVAHLFSPIYSTACAFIPYQFVVVVSPYLHPFVLRFHSTLITNLPGLHRLDPFLPVQVHRLTPVGLYLLTCEVS